MIVKGFKDSGDGEATKTVTRTWILDMDIWTRISQQKLGFADKVRQCCNSIYAFGEVRDKMK